MKGSASGGFGLYFDGAFHGTDCFRTGSRRKQPCSDGTERQSGAHQDYQPVSYQRLELASLFGARQKMAENLIGSDKGIAPAQGVVFI